MKEAKVLLNTLSDPDIRAAVRSWQFAHVWKVQRVQTLRDDAEDLLVLVRESENAAAVAALGVENAGEKPLAPIRRCRRRPVDGGLDRRNLGTRLRADGVDRLSRIGCCLEEERSRGNRELV